MKWVACESMATTRPLKLACIGCGARAQTYATLATRRPDRFEIIAGADPVPERVQKVRGISGREDFRGFPSAEALLAAGKLADVVIVATQDNDHYRCCTGALRLGYNVLLEKPISTRVEQVLEIERLARQMDRRVMVCFVLRFAAFYRKVKEIIDSGALGEIVSIQASEGVMPWHQAHSFVRGHWSVVGKSSPMILSKCCHDTDIVHWLAGRRCRELRASVRWNTSDLNARRREHRPGAPTAAPSAKLASTIRCVMRATCACRGWRWSMTTRKRQRRRKSPPGCAPARGAAACIIVTTTPWTAKCWRWSSRAG